jgi:hypothetical protein
MHRQTPLTAGFVGYSGGGSRTLIDTVDDGQLMQEMKGTMMYGEGRQKVEAPQNYGFTSVVRKATKGADGQIEDCAEGYMSYAGGNRTHSFCAVMDDRRYRPLKMKEGENAQYDDLGQMTLIRRTGTYVLSLDGPDDSQQQGQSGGTPTPHDGSGSSQQTVARFASLRHVNKQKQQRPPRSPAAQPAGGAQQQQNTQQQDYKHEGDSVNTEVRCSKNRIEFYAGSKVVGYYDVQADTWFFTGKVITQQVTDHFETVGKTYLGLDNPGEKGPLVSTVTAPAKQTFAKV